MIQCNKHNLIQEMTIGDKHYCPICVQEVLEVRIKPYELIKEW